MRTGSPSRPALAVANTAPLPGAYGRAAAWLSKQLELALADVELSLPQYRIMGLLAEGASLPSALAQRLAVRRPTITAVVDGLEVRGLVERTHDGDDKRSVTHTLTPKGQRLRAKADAAVDSRLRTIASSLGDAELTNRALDSLALWGEAMYCYHEAKAVRT